MSAPGAPDLAALALLAATWLHAGFQVTVTVLVYPVFARVRREDWAAHHARHSRAITPLVVAVYGLLLVAAAAVLLRGPSSLESATLTLLAGTVLATATVAAPAHGRLGAGRDPAFLRRLVVADRIRAGLAVTAAVVVAAGLAAGR